MNDYMNSEIRHYIKEAGLHNYQIAKAIGYSEAQFYRILREELSEDLRARIIQAVDYLVEEGGVMANV